MQKPKCHQEFPIYHPRKKYFISYLMDLLNDFETDKEINPNQKSPEIRKKSPEPLPMRGQDFDSKLLGQIIRGTYQNGDIFIFHSFEKCHHFGMRS